LLGNNNTLQTIWKLIESLYNEFIFFLFFFF